MSYLLLSNMSLCEVTGAGAAANLKLNQTQLPSNHFSNAQVSTLATTPWHYNMYQTYQERRGALHK